MKNPREMYKDKEWLLDQYESLGSIYKIAECAGVHARTIHYWMKKYNIPMHSMKGMKRSEESIRKSVDARKGRPGSMTGKKHSEETKKKMSLSRKGVNNANWKGGITEKIRKFRRSKEYVAWVKAVYKKSDGKCEMCGSEENLEAHHIIGLNKDFSKALDIENGQLLCDTCHKKLHKGEQQ